MKLTQEQKDQLHISYRIHDQSHEDIETIHQNFDKLMKERLTELDPEFLKELEKEVEDIGFWYA